MSRRPPICWLSNSVGVPYRKRNTDRHFRHSSGIYSVKVPDGAVFVDVPITGENHRITLEVALQGSIDQEIRTLSKSPRVIVLSEETQQLRKVGMPSRNGCRSLPLKSSDSSEFRLNDVFAAIGVSTRSINHHASAATHRKTHYPGGTQLFACETCTSIARS